MLQKPFVAVVGRDSAACAICVGHKTVSRQHCKIIVRPEGGIFIADAGSRNGTKIYVGGKWQKVNGMPTAVTPKTEVALGAQKTDIKSLLALCPKAMAFICEVAKNAQAPVAAKPTTKKPPAKSSPRAGGKEIKRDPETGEIIKA